MTSLNIEPAEPPDSLHRADAIQKGLGRALLWARKGLWTDEATLLNACLHDLRYDRQCEKARGPWLWQIMEAVSATDAFCDAIHDSLLTIDNGLAGQQLCQFAVFYARRGDQRFRQRLREIVANRPDPFSPSFGEKELIDLDGQAGFLFAAQVRGETLASRESDWEDQFFLENSIARLGESVVLTILERDSQSSAAVKRLYDGWRMFRERKAVEPRPSHAAKMRQISLSAVIKIVESGGNQTGILRGWGMYAQDADLRAIQDRLLNAQEPAIIANYLRVFSNRPLPEFREPFLALLDHEDENVRARAYAALAKNTHAAIRAYAVDHLNARIMEFGFLSLFIRNYLPGDEEALLKALRIPADEDQRHWLMVDLHKILEQNPESDCYELAKIIYRFTPCGSCRHDATKLLIKRAVAPAWLIEESRHDSVDETRHLAEASPTVN